MAMNVSLTPRLEEMVQEHVRSGRYSSASEVIRAAEAARGYEREQAVRFEQLKTDVQKGIDQLDAGQGRELTHEVFKDIKARGRASWRGAGASWRGLMARIVHSPAAEDDLLEIWVGLAANNASAAERRMDDLDAATQIRQGNH